MNELDLIREVEKRPILYNKSVRGFNKTKLRDHAWKYVREALNCNGSTFATEVECKKRWRSLRDSYIKLQRTHGGKTRWPYANAMKFLKSHVIETKDECNEEPTGSDSDQEEEKPRIIQSTTIRQPDAASMAENEEKDSPQPSPMGQRTSSSGEEISSCQCNRNDPDELFLLSCAPILKRLNSKQNAVARLKIQQALLESEFGSKAATDQPKPENEVQQTASLPTLL